MQMHVPAPGGHMVYNALAALAAGRALGVSLEDICRGIEAYAPLPGRMCIERCGALTILNDVYNANPGSVKAALDVLAFADGRRVCVLGDMLELGDDAPRYHREVGAYAAQKGIERVVCVGTLAKQLYAGARAEGAVALHFATQQALLEALPELVLPGDTVLVKASRGMALEKTVEALRRRATEDERVL